MYADKGDQSLIDELVQDAIDEGLSKAEVFVDAEYPGTAVLEEARSVVKCVPAIGYTSSRLSVWNFFPNGNMRRQLKVTHYFDPATRKLIIEPNDTAVRVRYLKDTEFVTVEDLSPMYARWIIKYAVVLLKEAEGSRGTDVKMTDMPFDMNYEAMLEQARTEKEALLEEMNTGMYMGTMSIRTN